VQEEIKKLLEVLNLIYYKKILYKIFEDYKLAWKELAK